MSKLKSLVAEAVKAAQAEIDSAANEALAATAKAPNTTVPSGKVTTASRMKGMSIEAQRLGEIGFIAKTMRAAGHEDLSTADKTILDARFKAIGVTGDITELLPSGFTNALMRDLQERLVITGLFPYKQTEPGKYDSIALNGITAYLMSEATAGTESAEDYGTMIYLVEKIGATVKKSYEAIDDAMIDLAAEVRLGIMDALARAVENAVVNGDDSATHMDNAQAAVAATDARKAFKGLRKLGMAKAPVDAGGAALDEAGWLSLIGSMQEAGSIYLDDAEVSMGNVVLLVPQHVYNQFRTFSSFLTKEKAGLGTLFGMEVASIFGIPVIQTPFLRPVGASGYGEATANTFYSILMVNKNTFKYYTTGAPMLETDKDIYSQFFGFVGSVRHGFNSVFDRDASNPTAIDTTRVNIVAAYNIV